MQARLRLEPNDILQHAHLGWVPFVTTVHPNTRSVLLFVLLPLFFLRGDIVIQNIHRPGPTSENLIERGGPLRDVVGCG